MSQVMRVVKKRRTYKPKPKKRVVLPRFEVKHFDFNMSQNVTQAGVLTCISTITQGVQDIQRVGTKVTFKNLKFYANVIAKAASYNDDLRIIVLLDRQGYNTPVITDILEPGTVATNFAPLSQYNFSYLGRFKILYDKSFSLSGGTANTSFLIKKEIRMNTIAHYIGAGTNFSNQIYVLHIGNNNNVLTYPTINVSCRLSFTDD